MSALQKLHTELNQVQVSLLRLFNRPMSEKETNDLKKLLVNHYSALLEKEATNVVAEKGYTQKDFDNMLNSEN
jgi:cytochrome c biogenesis protein ResB